MSTRLTSDQISTKIKQLQAQRAELIQREKAKARKERTHRLIQHGALGEKYLECAAWQLNQVEAFYSFLLTVPAVKDYLATHNNMKGENTNEQKRD